MNDADGRGILVQAFAAAALAAPSRAELQIVGAISCVESGCYGKAYGGTNWGSIQSTARPPCPPGTFEYGDTHPTSSGSVGYQACFIEDPSPLAAATRLVRMLYHEPGFPAAARAGDSTAAAQAMYKAHYFEGFGATPAQRVANYAKGIQANAESIAKRLGEPLAVRPGGASSSGGEVVVAAALIGLGLLIASR